MTGRSAITTRVLLATALVAVWAAAWALLRPPAGIDPARYVPVERRLADPEPAWEREAAFTMIENHLREPGPYLPIATADDAPLQVLVLGDSFTYGWGVADRSRVWPRQLQAALDEAAPGRFAVSALARGGASLFTQNDWVSKWRAGDQAALGPGTPPFPGMFDVVIQGFLPNDLIANGYDSVAVVMGADVPAVDATREAAMLRDPTADAVGAALPATLRSLAGMADVALWMPLEWAPRPAASLDAVASLFDAAGFQRVPRPHTDELLRTTERWVDLMVNPVDAHPATALHAAYARDAAAAVLAATKDTLNTSEAPPARRLTTRKYMTFPSTFTAETNTLNLPPASVPVPCTPGEECCVRIGDGDVPCASRTTFHYLINGRAIDPLTAPCMDTTGHRSYVEAYVADTATLSARAVLGAATAMAFRYDNGVRVWLDAHRITPAASAQWSSSGLAGIRFVFDDATACAPPPPFQVVLTVDG